MNGLRQHPFLVAGLLVAGGAVLVEGAVMAGSHLAARSARRRLDRAGREWRSLNAIVPTPTPENAARIEAELARRRGVLAGLEAQRAARAAADAAGRLDPDPVPALRPEAFFAIAAFVEKMRAGAERSGVRLKPDERFGFSAYAHEAPESALLAGVHCERVTVQRLLAALFEARPSELLSVQREHPSRPAGPPAGTHPARSGLGRGAGADGSDYFELDPRAAGQFPGGGRTTAFRLSFTGRTAVLRSLLNTLAAAEPPLIVRSVEVVPAETTSAGSAPKPRGAVPLAGSRLSCFTVVIVAIDSGPLRAAGS